MECGDLVFYKFLEKFIINNLIDFVCLRVGEDF